MAKIVKIFLILSLVFGILGANSAFFSEFDAKFDTSSKAAKERYHVKLKEIYLKSQNDKNLRIQTLNRLIYSSDSLNYNSNSYKKELSRLGGNYQPKKPKVESLKKEIKKDNKTSEITQNKEPKKKSVDAKNSVKTENVTSQITHNKTPKKEAVKSALNLNSITKSDDGLVLKFNRDISEDEFKKFVIDGKDNYRSVIDFNALKSAKVDKLKDFMVDEIRIAQFEAKKVRVVFTSKRKNELDMSISGDKLILKALVDETKNNNKTIDKTASKSPQNSARNSKIQTEKPKKQAKEEYQKEPISKRKTTIIVIDPGHGGKDSGANGNGLKEKDVVLKIAKSAGELFKKRGYKVYYTRNTDVFINLKSRTAFANKKNADLFISIHANAAPNASLANNFSGLETFFLSPARSDRSKNAAALENKGDIEDMNYFSKETFLNFLNREKIISSNKLAIDIQGQMLSSLKTRKFDPKDGGVREAPFWVLVGATMPAILIEIGYITHPTEGKNLGKASYQNGIAQGIVNGVDAYFMKNR